MNEKQKEAMDLIESYIRMMDERCAEIELDIKHYDEDVFVSEDYEFFDREKMERFVRTWDIIKNKLSPSRRNLYLLYCACGSTPATFDYLSSIEYSITNTTSLTQSLYYIKEQILIIYARTYGTVHIKRLSPTFKKKIINADIDRKSRMKKAGGSVDKKKYRHEYYIKNKEYILERNRQYKKRIRAKENTNTK